MLNMCWTYKKKIMVLGKYVLFNMTSKKLFFAFSCLFASINLVLYMQLLLQFSKMEPEISFDKSFRLQNSNSHYIPDDGFRLQNSSSHYIPDDGFAGCLVLKDDNARLSEWLAYHWLVLPLKYLVVAVDPTGKHRRQQKSKS